MVKNTIFVRVRQARAVLLLRGPDFRSLFHCLPSPVSASRRALAGPEFSYPLLHLFPERCVCQRARPSASAPGGTVCQLGAGLVCHWGVSSHGNMSSNADSQPLVSARVGTIERLKDQLSAKDEQTKAPTPRSGTTSCSRTCWIPFTCWTGRSLLSSSLNSRTRQRRGQEYQEPTDDAPEQASVPAHDQDKPVKTTPGWRWRSFSSETYPHTTPGHVWFERRDCVV